MTRHQLEVRVTDEGGRPVETAAVFLTPEASGERRRAEFDEWRQAHYFDGLRPGFYLLEVDSPPRLTHVERVQVHPKPTRVDCTLVGRDTTHTIRGATRVPYDSKPDLLGVIPAPAPGGDEDESGQTLYGLLASLGLVPVRVVGEDEVAGESDESARWREETERERGEAKRERGGPPAGLVVRRTRASDEDEGDEGGDNELSVLRRSPLVEAAGPLFRLYDNSFSVFTNRLMVLFYPEVNRDQVKRLLVNFRLSLLRPTDFAPNQFLVEADPSVGEAINRIAAQLMESRLVAAAEPSIAEVPEEDAVIPRDYLWPAGWDRKHVGLEEAWQRLRDRFGRAGQFGSPEVILAVVDNGIKSVGGMPENEDFHGTVSDGSYKIYKLYDFRGPTPRPHNDVKVNSRHPQHGLACAGVAAGRADNMSADSEVGVGLAGAAPNVRLMGLTRPADEPERLQMLLWAAGIDSAGRPHNYPQPISPGADIFTCSLAFGRGAPLSAAAKGALDHITRRGRNGKGCLAFFSAGNGAQGINDPAEKWPRPYGAYDRSFSCAASTLDARGDEVHADYSGFGEEVDWCAPSSTAVPAEHKPPHSYGVLTASFVGEGDIPSFPDFTTILTHNASAGDRRIYVLKANGLGVGRRILIEEPGVNGSEHAQVLGTSPAAPTPYWDVDVTPLVNDHAGAAEVAAGRNNHRTNFAGTSSATPLCAGIAALVLSANPDLTWVEAREILRSTAEKIDTNNNDPTGLWLNENDDSWRSYGGSPVRSEWYGYGRLDADAAVEAALAYDFPRDLMIRGEDGDDGSTETALNSDSPDIWVRNADPARDPLATPTDDDSPGPHEDPRADSGRWVYARVRNRGTRPSYDAWVRFYVASYGGTPFIYPQDWEGKNGQSNYLPYVWEPGTYFIGEMALDSIPPGGSYVACLPWPDGLLPPEFTPAGEPWDPHILVEVTPHDGPLRGRMTHQNNNLAQRSVVIIR